MEVHDNQQSNQSKGVWNDGVEHFVLQLGDLDIDSRDEQRVESFWNGLSATDHGCLEKGSHQKWGHQSTPRYHRGYCGKNPGKEIEILWSCRQNGQLPKCLPNIALYGRVEGSRARGSPRKRWLDNVTEDCNRRGWGIVEATHLANNRRQWRKVYDCHSMLRHHNDNKRRSWWDNYIERKNLLFVAWQ